MGEDCSCNDEALKDIASAIEQIHAEIKKIWDSWTFSEKISSKPSTGLSYMFGLSFALDALGDETPFHEIIGEEWDGPYTVYLQEGETILQNLERRENERKGLK